MPSAAILPVLAWLCALPCAGAESLEVRGIVYENVVIRSTSPSHLILGHDGGIAQVALADLPPEWQERLDYDPAVAARHQARIEAQARQQLQARQPRAPVEAANPPPVHRLSPAIDFREGKPAAITRAKDQGRRPVNDIYAVVTALEYAYSMNGREAVPLSEEFVLWALGETFPDLTLGKGLHLAEIIKAIQIHGVCREDLLTNRILQPVSEVTTPPLAAINDAAQRRNLQAVLVPAVPDQAHAQILYQLNQGRPVVMALRWPHPNTLSRNATLRAQVPLEGAAHVVTVIGYQPDPSDPAGVLLIFRNSFGPQWGRAGHGFLALDYLNRHFLGGFAVDLFEGNNLAAVRTGAVGNRTPDR